MSPPSSREPSPSRPIRRVLIVGASVGSGHNQAAAGIEAQLRRDAPHLEVERVDVLDFTSKVFRLKYAGGYTLAVTRLGWLYGLGYAVTNRPKGPNRTIFERRRLWAERRALRKFYRHIEQTRPDLVVQTHFLGPPGVQRMRETGRWKGRQAVVVTDVEAHRWWYCENVDRWFTGYSPGREQLIGFGVDPQRITVSGMPIHPKWTDPLPDEAILRREWTLPEDRPVLLLSGGTDFTCGPIVRIARRLADRIPRAVVVVIAGRNKKLLARLSRLPQTVEGRIRPQGFTDRLPELAAVAELFVTKAGGMTTAECLSKSLPMVFLKPVPGQEKRNAQFFEAAGAGVIAKSTGRIVDRVGELMENDTLRGKMARAAGDLHQGGASIIVRTLLEGC